MSAALLKEHFLPHFGHPALLRLGDGAVVPVGPCQLVVSTDTFVVSPLEFPGGDIGSLAVHGTLNDVAMMGARPLYLTAGFVLEEGLSFDQLDRIVRSVGRSAAAAGVPLVSGDTKVVERGKADGLFINTTGLGLLAPEFAPAPDRARAGDAVPESLVEPTLAALRGHPLGALAARVGKIVAGHPGLVVLRTGIGGARIVDQLPGDQLPRIC
jgi:hydrogenase expression/formation protein HypE